MELSTASFIISLIFLQIKPYLCRIRFTRGGLVMQSVKGLNGQFVSKLSVQFAQMTSDSPDWNINITIRIKQAQIDKEQKWTSS